VKVAASAVDAVTPRTRSAGVVVLAYHQVGAPVAAAVNLPTSLFRDQVAILRAEADVVALDAAVDRLAAAAGAVNGSRAASGSGTQVVVTFDDGTADFVDHALPVLVEHEVPVTLYVATEFVEHGRSFWDDGTTLSWAALRDALATGLVTIGSHTHTHALLDRTTPLVAADELDRSIDLLRDRLGVDATHFAYPKALAPSSPFVEQEVRRRFRSAAVAGGRVNRWGATDPWRLGRSPVLVDDGITWFERKQRGGLWLEGVLRERLDHYRYEKATR
jgi:peptidoglycan/xylan/chitin deacetylase (PgdA/CDA1 family)